MSRRQDTIGAGFFDDLYSADPDPWRFRTSDYEHEKYQATLAALRQPRYARGLEVGCAIGVLTRQLATRCDSLLAIDGSAVALSAAARECAECCHVSFARALVPAEFPAGDWDLIVLSEMLYYLVPGDLEAVASLCFDALRPGGEIILCHWLGETDYPLPGREASDLFLAAATRRALLHTRLVDGAYLLERLEAP